MPLARQVGFKRKLPMVVTHVKREKSQAAEIKMIKRKLYALKPEVKVSPQSATVINVAGGAGAITYLSAIAQGSDIQNRIGDTISPTLLEIKLEVSANATGVSAGVPFFFKVLLIKDRESNGVLPTISGGAQAIFANADPLNALINPNTRDRFKIVKEWNWHSLMLQLGSDRNLRESNIKLFGKTRYHDTTNAITGAGANAYYLVWLTNTTAGATSPNLSFDSRFCYTDI